MPDPILIMIAMSASLAVSAALVTVIGRGCRPVWTGSYNAGWTLGIGVGFFVGCWVLGIRPHWLPREDLDRLLIVMLPAVIFVELLAVFPQMPRWLVWPLRLALVVSSGWVLLHGTSYITDLTGPGTREWRPSLAWLILGGLAALEGVVWALLSLLARRARGSSPSISIAITTAGAAVVVMLSGYATGGQIGLPLAAAIMGAVVAALILTRASQGALPLGIPIVGLFSLLVIGRFFGELSSVHAVLLFCIPLLGWLAELPQLGRLPAWVRAVARVVVVGAAVTLIVIRAQTKFDRDFRFPTAAGSKEPSIQDYLDFRR
jgi:hypothetical protein